MNPLSDTYSPEMIARAREMLDESFGIGADNARKILRENVGAKAIYDCAVMALAKSIADTTERAAKMLDDHRRFGLFHGIRDSHGRPISRALRNGEHLK